MITGVLTGICRLVLASGRRWRWGSSSAAPQSFPQIPLDVGLELSREGGGGESWGPRGHSCLHVPSPPLSGHQESKERVQNPTRQTACTCLDSNGFTSGASSLSPLLCRDKDDIGKLIRGSINLSSATAQRIDSKTLYLSNDRVTYYLKSDSIEDMAAFIKKLQELKVTVTDI